MRRWAARFGVAIGVIALFAVWMIGGAAWITARPADPMLWPARDERIVDVYVISNGYHAGLALPRDDWDWNDQLELAKKLTLADGKQWGIWFRKTWDLDIWQYVQPNLKNPLSIYADKEETKVGYDTAEGLQAFQWFIDLIYKHKVAPNPAAASAMKTAETGDLFLLGVDLVNFPKFARVDDTVTYPKAGLDIRQQLDVDSGAELPDYSGSYRADLRFTDFSKEALAEKFAAKPERTAGEAAPRLGPPPKQ